MRPRACRIGSKSRTSPFKLRVNHTSRGVFFDRMDGRDRLMVLHTTPSQARALATWILENVPEVQS